MAKWVASILEPNALEEAIEAIDNTVTLHIVQLKDGKVLLVQATA